MRIDAFNRVSQLYQNNSTRNIAKAGKTTQPDRVEISQMGKDYQVAKAAVEKAPEIREDVVADIRERMANGTYQMDMDALADKLLSGYIC
ncbi:MAG: flagellar biosynthesis anti-sigma factor FlgM [Lachnospiraceae bacterium]|nr:flagellar biosynthesis anti-sigma factor FlgM [Lachnospiraceae bacterium]